MDNIERDWNLFGIVVVIAFGIVLFGLRKMEARLDALETPTAVKQIGESPTDLSDKSE